MMVDRTGGSGQLTTQQLESSDRYTCGDVDLRDSDQFMGWYHSQNKSWLSLVNYPNQ